MNGLLAGLAHAEGSIIVAYLRVSAERIARTRLLV